MDGQLVVVNEEAWDFNGVPENTVLENEANHVRLTFIGFHEPGFWYFSAHFLHADSFVSENLCDTSRSFCMHKLYSPQISVILRKTASYVILTNLN